MFSFYTIGRSLAIGNVFPGVDYKSEIDKAEITRAIDEASGPIFLRNWVEVRTLILQYLRDHESFLGENLAIFLVMNINLSLGICFTSIWYLLSCGG